MALFKRPRKAPEPQPPAPDAITIYLGNDDREFDPDEHVHITIEGFTPYLDEELTIRLEENQNELAAERIVYSRIVGGTHHEADLNNAVFDLALRSALSASSTRPPTPTIRMRWQCSG